MIRTALICLLTATPVLAQDLPDQGAAKRLLFSTRNSTITVLPQPFLAAEDIAALEAMPKVAGLKYYGALAAAPNAGLQAETSTGAFNYHSLDAARKAAVAGCDAKRSGGASCVVVAEVTPRNYQDGRALTLSQDASAVVSGRDFRRAGSNATLAISPSSGSWGLGDGSAAAIATCAASGARDCEAVVAR